MINSGCLDRKRVGSPTITLEHNEVTYVFSHSGGFLHVDTDKEGEALAVALGGEVKCENLDGDRFIYFDGLLHCLDGPAVMLVNGSEFRYENGLLHCLDGPAVVGPNGFERWWVDGHPVTSNF